MLKQFKKFRRNKSFRKALAYLQRHRPEIRFGGAACIFLSLLERAYYSNWFQVIIYNSGQKLSGYEEFINTVFFVVGAIGVAYGFTDFKLDKEDQSTHILDASAFIPSLSQYILIRVSVRLPIAEEDRLEEIELALQAALARVAATLPPSTPKHEIYKLLEQPFQSAVAPNRLFSSGKATIMSCDYRGKDPRQIEKPKTDSASNWV